MIKAVIIDDERHAIEALSIQLQKYCPKVEVIFKTTVSLEGLVYLKNGSPDLLFLDVEMPSPNGFELLSQIPYCNFKVVFTTAYDKFAIKALKYSAFDFLLKPVDEIELMTVIDKFEFVKSQNEKERQVEFLKQTGLNNFLRIALPTSEGLEFIEVDNIIRCKADSNYCEVFIKDRKKMVISRTLKDMEELLDESKFIRVHQTHLVNIKAIKKFIRTDGGYLVLSDSTEIPVARSRKEMVISKLT